MRYDLLTILGLCGIIGLAFWLLGFCMLLVAVQKGRGEFRSKGYLRIPSGRKWLRFLLLRQYEVFNDFGTRFFFGAAHFCLMGTIIALIAVMVLLGCELLFNGMYGFSEFGVQGPPVNINQ